MSRPDHNSLSYALLARTPSRLQLDKTAVALGVVRETAPRSSAGDIAMPPAWRAAVLRCATSQCATDSVHVHICLRLFATQSTPLGRHGVVERGKVQRAETIGKLVAERVTLRLGCEYGAWARSSLDEQAHPPRCVRFLKNRSETIGERGNQFGYQAPRVGGSTFESGCECRSGARQLLFRRATKADTLTIRPTARHALLESLHISDADALPRDCGRHGSASGTASAPCAPSR